MSDLTEFKQITSNVLAPSVWRGLWDWSEETLRGSRFDGFEVEDIGRTAFDCLSEAEKAAALDELFYRYWESIQDERDRAHRGGAA